MKTKTEKKKSSSKGSSPFFNSKNSSGFFGVQPKLKVGQPGDKYEVEADRVADEVVNSQSENQPFFAAPQTQLIQQNPITESITPLVQFQEEEEEELQPKLLDISVQRQEEEEEELQMQPEEEEMLQPKSDSPVTDTHATTEQKLNSSKGNGSSLDSETRVQMEGSFGADFSDVKIHTDSTAVQLNKELGAQAFTTGNDIYFNEGKYQPDSQNGKKLLAHELTHTVQQGNNVISAFIQRSTAAQSLERIEDAASGWGTDEEGIFSAIRECSQRSVLKASAMPILNSELSGYDLFKAKLLLKYGPESNFPPGILLIWEATNGAGTNERLVYEAIRSSSNRDKLKHSTWVQRILRNEMSGHDYAKTQLLFRYGTESSYPFFISPLWRATEGVGTNEDLLFNTMISLTPTNKTELSATPSFVQVIRDDLSGSELSRFNNILNGNGPAIQPDDPNSRYGSTQSGPIATTGADSDDTNAYSPDDVNQGVVGDCYFVASLSAVARSNPASLRNRIIRQSDGSYNVTLYVRDGDNFRQQVVNVTAIFPQNNRGTGGFSYARGGDVNSEGTELWVRLFEKAYAKLRGSYDEIEADWAAVGLESITGEQAENIALDDITNANLKTRIDQAFRANKPVTTTSNSESFFNNLTGILAEFATSHNIVGPHVYAVMSVTDLSITLRNPHGGSTAIVTLPWGLLRYYFYRVSTIRIASS